MPFNKPDISQLSALGNTVGDVYFPQTKLLLPFNGANAATTTSDLSNSNHTVTFNGTAQISTAQSKFGGSSVLFDGNSDYLTFDFPTLSSTFTVECWSRASTLSGYRTMITNYGGSTTGWFIQYINGYLKVGFAGNNPHIASTTTLSTDTWYHVALSGSAGSYKLFLNGTQEGSTYTGSTQLAGRSEASIGALYSGGYTSFFHGYIDDVRVTSGVVRYTSNFTPPTTAHLTSAGDVNKQILINSTADGVAIGTGGINQARIAKAWVNFDGTGTVAIRESYNISSLTDRGTGLYTLNYSSSLSSADCSGAGAAVDATGDATERNRVVNLIPNNVSSSYVNAFSIDSSLGADDCEIVTFLIFGN
jgi:hypothetical protein